MPGADPAGDSLSDQAANKVDKHRRYDKPKMNRQKKNQLIIRNALVIDEGAKQVNVRDQHDRGRDLHLDRTAPDFVLPRQLVAYRRVLDPRDKVRVS